MIECPDTTSDHLQAGLRCRACGRLREHAERHLLRAIELAEGSQRTFVLVTALHGYGRLLNELGRPREAVVQRERRLDVPAFANEDKLERRTTKAGLAELKDALSNDAAAS